MPEPLLTQEPWQAFAPCKSIADKTLFFDETRSGVARQFCRTNCPVRYDCLEFAYRTSCQYGVFGGFDERERERMLKTYGPKGIAQLIAKHRLTKEACNDNVPGRDGVGTEGGNAFS